MLGINTCPQCKQELELNHSVAEGNWIRPRCNAHVFNAMNESAQRKEINFRSGNMIGGKVG